MGCANVADSADLGGEGAVSDGEVSADGASIAENLVFSTVAVWDGSRLPLGISPMIKRVRVRDQPYSDSKLLGRGARRGLPAL